MPRSENSLVLVTRPKASSDRFVAQLLELVGPFPVIVSPAFENVGTGGILPDFDIAIFTSRAGVAFAPLGQGRTAFCVGAATATAANEAGYKAVSSNGTASDLVKLILDRQPTQRLAHVRGEVSLGNVSMNLSSAGIDCIDAVVYRKSPRPPDPHVGAAFEIGVDTVVPLFSAETVSILTNWPYDFSRTHVVAISAAVAKAAQQLNPATITVSDQPDQASMVAQTARLIA